jgi:P27 family predicted phage terminase small subunit
MPGPSPKPSHLKKLEGTYKEGNELRVPSISEPPKPPDYLNEDQKNNFTWICKTLIEINILANCDVHLMVTMACAMSLHKVAIIEIEKKGAVITTKNGYMQPNPYVAIMRDCEKTIERISNLFGLNPSARTKIPMPEAKQNNKLTLLLNDINKNK